MGINVKEDGIPSILPGIYRDALRSKDRKMIQEVLTIFELRLLTPEFKTPDQSPLESPNASNLTIEEAQSLQENARKSVSLNSDEAVSDIDPKALKRAVKDSKTGYSTSDTKVCDDESLIP